MKIWNNYPEDFVKAELQLIKERAAHLTLCHFTVPIVLITLNLINISSEELKCFESQCKRLGWEFSLINDLPTISIPVALIKKYKSELKMLELEKDFTND